MATGGKILTCFVREGCETASGMCNFDENPTELLNSLKPATSLQRLRPRDHDVILTSHDP